MKFSKLPREKNGFDELSENRRVEEEKLLKKSNTGVNTFAPLSVFKSQASRCSEASVLKGIKGQDAPKFPEVQI